MQAEKVAPRRALHLVTPIDGAQTFTVGEDDCQSITPLPGGAGYEVTLGPKLLRIPEHRAAYYEQDPRPGYERELANGKRELPSYAHRSDDGMFWCQKCGKGARTLHALSVHFGRAHGDERDE